MGGDGHDSVSGLASHGQRSQRQTFQGFLLDVFSVADADDQLAGTDGLNAEEKQVEMK
jgi:hypothetical protein